MFIEQKIWKGFIHISMLNTGKKEKKYDIYGVSFSSDTLIDCSLGPVSQK